MLDINGSDEPYHTPLLEQFYAEVRQNNNQNTPIMRIQRFALGIILGAALIGVTYYALARMPKTFGSSLIASRNRTQIAE